MCCILRTLQKPCCVLGQETSNTWRCFTSICFGEMAKNKQQAKYVFGINLCLVTQREEEEEVLKTKHLKIVVCYWNMQFRKHLLLESYSLETSRFSIPSKRGRLFHIHTILGRLQVLCWLESMQRQNSCRVSRWALGHCPHPYGDFKFPRHRLGVPYCCDKQVWEILRDDFQSWILSEPTKCPPGSVVWEQGRPCGEAMVGGWTQGTWTSRVQNCWWKEKKGQQSLLPWTLSFSGS